MTRVSIITMSFTILLGWLLWFGPDVYRVIPENFNIMEAEVTHILSDDREEHEQEIVVELHEEERAVEAVNRRTPVNEGDTVYLAESTYFDEDIYEVMEVGRTSGLIAIIGIFALLVVLVGGWRGARSLISLTWSFLVLLAVFVPMILQGLNPVVAALVSSLFVLAGTLYVSYGANRKSGSAALGIVGSLSVVAVLAYVLSSYMYLTGFAGEGVSSFSMMDIDSLPFNFFDLMVAGIIIAGLGVLDDVAVTQASVVDSLRRSNSNMSKRQLFTEAMRIGRDHIGAVVNTLALAYAGASLPLLIFFGMQTLPVPFIVSMEIVAQEIVRTFVASFGLVLAIPLTTMIAVFWLGGDEGVSSDDDALGHHHH